MTTKEQLKDRIATILGLSEEENPPMSTGSTEPKRIFELVDQRLQLNLDPDLEKTKPQLAGAIVRHSGGEWSPDCESRGGTVTKIGLTKVLGATILLQRRHRRHQQQQQGCLTLGAPGFPENDYVALRDQRNTGIAAEFGTAASLMPPEQRGVFEVETISRHSRRRRIQQIDGALDPDPINFHCLPGIGNTDIERYIFLVPQNDELGPSDLIVYDLRRSASVGISIKEDNLNFKNSGTSALGLPDHFKPTAEAQIPDFIPDWIAEQERREGDLLIARDANGILRRNWGGRGRTSNATSAYTRSVGDQVVHLFNALTVEERLTIVRSLFDLDNEQGITELFIVETSKDPVCVQKIFKQHFDQFVCRDPYMETHSNSAVRIRDNSNTDPFIIEVQIKLNNSIAEYYSGSYENRRPFTIDHYQDAPNQYFIVENQHGEFVQKYGELTSWNVRLITPPTFWELLYSHNAL